MKMLLNRFNKYGWWFNLPDSFTVGRTTFIKANKVWNIPPNHVPDLAQDGTHCYVVYHIADGVAGVLERGYEFKTQENVLTQDSTYIACVRKSRCQNDDDTRRSDVAIGYVSKMQALKAHHISERSGLFKDMIGMACLLSAVYYLLL